VKTPLLARRGLLFGAILIGMLAMAGSASSQNAPRQHIVTMSNMSFGRIPANLKVGDTIIWVNGDTVPHSITARDKSFDLRTGPRRRAQMTLKKAGTIPIYCIYHPAMRASLKVAAS
jgi:plastocyanin